MLVPNDDVLGGQLSTSERVHVRRVVLVGPLLACSKHSCHQCDDGRMSIIPIQRHDTKELPWRRAIMKMAFIYPVKDLGKAKTLHARVLGVEPYVDKPYSSMI